MRRQLRETRKFVQELWQQQQQVAEDADTWTRAVRRAAESARQETKELKNEIEEKMTEEQRMYLYPVALEFFTASFIT